MGEAGLVRAPGIHDVVGAHDDGDVRLTEAVVDVLHLDELVVGRATSEQRAAEESRLMLKPEEVSECQAGPCQGVMPDVARGAQGRVR